jgi:pimeloyl-ACP methyl ester carboxylesterase
MNKRDDAQKESVGRGNMPLSRRRMLKGSGVALAALGLAGTTGFSNPGTVRIDEIEQGMSERHEPAKPNIVLVHGAWADGSSWSAVIEQLQKAGYTVTAPQFPLTTLDANLARLREVLDVQTGPTIAVGHSYGGQIITALGADAPNVVGLVYIAAFGLDEGESIGALLGQGPPTPALAHLRVDAQGFAWLPQSDFVTYFAADVDREQANVMYAVQQPLSVTALGDIMGVPAWKSLPSWYLVATNDQAIPPDAERFFAQRMDATTVEVASSHVAMVSHPDAVVKLIKAAARAVS